jgi:hypothetical protein
VASKLRWLAAIALAAATVAGGAGAAQAQAAATPGWRITTVYPEDSQVGAIAAAGANNAWTVEGCTRPCHTGHDGTTLRHWNGKQWQIISQLPAHEAGSYAISALEIAPGAKSNPWAFYSYKTYQQTAIAHWTGKSWSAPTVLPKNAYIEASVAPSSSAVWGFGGTATGKPYAVRYNGKSWSQAPAPSINVISASAASPTDIWVIGTKPGAAKSAWPMAVSHWNGTKWTTTVLPSVPVPGKTKAEPLSIVASGADDAWALGYRQGPGGSIVPNEGMVLYHWNGAKWSPVTFPYAESQAFTLSPDGQGGIWLWDEVDPGHHDFLVHDSGAGHWSEVKMPRPANAFSGQIYAFTPIPGTKSIWADGIASVPIPVGNNPGGTEGLILKLGA